MNYRPRRRERKRQLPKLPIPVGKAQQQLSQAIICSDHELASWIDRAVLEKQVVGSPEAIAALKQTLDEVMAPNDLEPGINPS